ncbi:MAG TPA: alginate lyase family protein [Polyangiaceae bacterium]|nr:alginate lyase family protein [Polyangiaceae bacterium]
MSAARGASVGSLDRWWQTLRWLRARQVYGRLWFHAYQPRPELEPAPTARFASGPWTTPVEREPSLLGPELVSLLDETRELGSPRSWDAPEVPRLWRYHLHYFDDLGARDAAARAAWHEALVHRWISENPPGRGTGWEPYPASRRIVNWIQWARAGSPLSATARDSLATQVRWLTRRLEWHLLGNHLWSNAKALIYAGCFFAGAEADAWRARGEAIFERELAEQVLGDGGHFELSPMYHALALEDVLDLLNAARAWPGRIAAPLLARLHAAAPRLSHWLDAMSHPDGDIAAFNDSALGLAPSGSALRAYAARLGLAPSAPAEPFEHLAASGYVRAERGPFLLFCDVGAIGPDYLPGHAHADSLSFELSLDGRRCVVDTGCSTYAAGPERSRQRGTLAHNTVLVDARDSSEVWSSFRVARRARVRDVSARAEAERTLIEAAHDGYAQRGGPIHRRRFELDARGVSIHDRLEGPFDRAEARLHLHPDVSVVVDGPGAARLELAGRKLVLRAEGAGLGLEGGSWHPTFNRSLPNRCVVARFAGSSAQLRLELA